MCRTVYVSALAVLIAGSWSASAYADTGRQVAHLQLPRPQSSVDVRIERGVRVWRPIVPLDDPEAVGTPVTYAQPPSILIAGDDRAGSIGLTGGFGPGFGFGRNGRWGRRGHGGGAIGSQPHRARGVVGVASLGHVGHRRGSRHR